MYVGKPSVLSMNFFSSVLFYQYTALSSHAVDGHQKYSAGHQKYSAALVVGKASTVVPEISPIPLIFRGIKKYEIWHRFQHYSTLSRPRLKMQQSIQTLKQKCHVVMITLCPCQVW